MALKQLVNRKIIDEVLNPLKQKGKWKVLVVDHFSMRIISYCCKMADILEEGVTIVEDLHKKRQPLPDLEAIYLITPSDKSIQTLINDFPPMSNSLYHAAHIYFTEACPDDLFKKLCKSPCAKKIKTLKEINVAFLPFESQVFHLDSPDAFQFYYSPKRATIREKHIERVADQLATVCATLSEFPIIRYRVDHLKQNQQFASLVHEKLLGYKADDPTLGQGPDKANTQLLILDRGFDCVSPLLHELTYQAAAYDLLPIENDVYKFELSGGQDIKEKEALLDENDKLWLMLRHLHLAAAIEQITKQMKSFSEDKKVFLDSSSKSSMKNLTKLIKAAPQHINELHGYSVHSHLTEHCLHLYESKKKLFKVEQDLAMGTDQEGDKIKDHMRNIIPILLDRTGIDDKARFSSTDKMLYSNYDKLRVILLYIISKNGISDENLTKLIQHAQIPASERAIITNMANLGINIIVNSGNRNKVNHYVRKEKEFQSRYVTSRWIPHLKDILEDCISGKLDPNQFSLLEGQNTAVGLATQSAAASARYGHWHSDKSRSNIKKSSRLIVFIMGGMTLSEMRTAYEVTKETSIHELGKDAVKSWEVVIGSTHILTPECLLHDLLEL